jgi:cell division ATPase FtsA
MVVQWKLWSGNFVKNSASNSIMAKNVTIGIDVGTHTTKVAIAELSKQGGYPKIIGTGECISKGVKRGYVVDRDLVAKSIKKALSDAEKMAGVKGRHRHCCYIKT